MRADAVVSRAQAQGSQEELAYWLEEEVRSSRRGGHWLTLVGLLMMLVWGRSFLAQLQAGLAVEKMSFSGQLPLWGLMMGIFGLLILTVLSWVGPGVNNPAGNLLWVMNEPLLKPIRRVIPPQGGLDFSPMVLIIALIFVRRLFALPAFF